MRQNSKNLFIIFIFVVFGSASHAVSAPLVKSGHPRIFISQDSLSELRNRAATTHTETYGRLKDWCETNWDNYTYHKKLYYASDGTFGDSAVLRYALIYLLGEINGFPNSAHSIDDYGDKAVEILLNMTNDSAVGNTTMRYMAIAYDWVNEKLSDADKSTIVTWFHARCGDVPEHNSQSNYRWVLEPVSMYPGLAFHGDGINDNLAQTYVEFIDEYLESLKEICHAAGEDGGHPAGLGYGKLFYGSGYALGHDLYALVSATSLTIDDTFDKYPYMNGYPSWLLYGTQPGPKSPAAYSSSHVRTLTKWSDIGSWMWNFRKDTSYPYTHALRLMGQVAKDKGDINRAGWITWFINEGIESPEQQTVWDIIFNDRTFPGLSPDKAGVPLVKAFGWDEREGKLDSYRTNSKAGLGQVYMKSSWDMGANTTHASFHAYPYYYYGHQHSDSLAFSLYKGEILTGPSGAYWMKYEGYRPDSQPGVGFPHHWYYYDRVASNTLLIMDPDEEIRFRAKDSTYGARDPYFRDGGQRTVREVGRDFREMVEGSQFDWGGLIRHEDTPEYTYSSGDATKGYNSIVDTIEYVGPITADVNNSAKVSLVQRDFVYLKSNTNGDFDYFVVFDRIDSTNPAFKKVFLLHTAGEPELNGNQTQIYGETDSGLYLSSDTDSFVMSQPTAKLFVKSLMPNARKVYKMGGVASTTTTAAINDTDGTAFGGTKVDISVTSTDGFSDKPVVVLDNGERKEAFQCEGKTDTQLTGCIRGYRYFKQNHPLVHTAGSTVTQEYAWMVQEADTGDWISYPHDFGTPYYDKTKFNDCDEYGRWALRIESTENENLTNFLHVLHPTTDTARQSMAETVLIDGGNTAGSLIRDVSNQWLVMFSKTKELQGSVSYSADYNGNSRHLITGLEFGVYDIYKNGELISTGQPSNQNILSFEANSGGSFQLTNSGKTPNNPPVAAPASDSTGGNAPLTVDFTGSGSDVDGNIVSYSWSFGDGGTSNQQNPSHTFNSAGNYSVLLTVTDDKGATDTKTLHVYVTSESSENGSEQNAIPAPSGLRIEKPPISPYVANDFTFYPVPSVSRPAKGVAFIDPTFHTAMRRITDSPTDVPGNSSNYAQSGYPKHKIENADESMLYIQAFSGSGHFIWNANPPYNKIQEIPHSQVSWGAEIDARWDATDPDILYYYRETRFYKYSVSANTSTLLRDFADDFSSLNLKKITMGEEGSPSLDTRYWCFALASADAERDEGYVVYDKDHNGKDQGAIISTMMRDSPLWLPMSSSDPTPNSWANWVGMSPSGNYAVITSWGGRAAIFNRDLQSKTHQGDFLETSTVGYGHNDVGYDVDGNEVICFGNTRVDPDQFGMINIATGEITWLAPMGDSNYHISVHHPGWAVMSNYYPTHPDVPTQWSEHEIYLVELTKRTTPPPKVWRIAHTHTVRKGYADDPFAKMNAAGTKIWFGSGWGNSYRDDQYDVYQIELPPAWKQVLANLKMN